MEWTFERTERSLPHARPTLMRSSDQAGRIHADILLLCYPTGLYGAGMQEVSSGELRATIGDVEPSAAAFLSLLQFLYSGGTSIPAEHCLYLFTAAQFFALTNMRLQVCKAGICLLCVYVWVNSLCAGCVQARLGGQCDAP